MLKHLHVFEQVLEQRGCNAWVVLHVHLLHFTWEGVAIPVLDCRYLLLLCANNCKEAGLNSSGLGSLVAWGYVYHL